jgi:hypothetical protein
MQVFNPNIRVYFTIDLTRTVIYVHLIIVPSIVLERLYGERESFSLRIESKVGLFVYWGLFIEDYLSPILQ